MILIPKPLYCQYLRYLIKGKIPVSNHAEHLKWLRYYLDFSSKYGFCGDERESIHMFIDKLKSKNQTEVGCKCAAYAVSLYFKMQRNDQKNLDPSGSVQESVPEPAPHPQSDCPSPNVTVVEHPQTPPTSIPSLSIRLPSSRPRQSQYSEAGYQVKSGSPEWDALLEKMADEIKVRHYSRKTLQTYAKWSRYFQRFLKDKPPAELSTEDVTDYLTFLAVKCRVAGSTQNQAFNSLLFLFRYGLKREFGDLREVPRAKKSSYIPVAPGGQAWTNDNASL